MKKTLFASLLGIAIASVVLFTSCESPYVAPEYENITCTLVNDDGAEVTKISVSTEKGQNQSCDINFDARYTKKTGYKLVKFIDLEGNEIKKFSSNIKVKAVFEPISYTVTFKKGLASSTEESKLPKDITVKYDEEFSMPENTLVYNGKKSSGWYTGYSSDKKTYSNGAKYKNLTDKDGDKVELKADFTDFDCIITFSDGKPTKYNLDKGVVLPAVPDVPAKAGYTADGWYESGDSAQKVVDFTNYKTTKSVTYTPKYTPKSYKVTFVTAHGTAPKTVEIYTDAKSIDITKGDYKLSATGYDFGGWYDSNNIKRYSLYSESKDWEKGDLTDVTLTAKWIPWKVTFSFDDYIYFLSESAVPSGFQSKKDRKLINNVLTDVYMPVLKVDYNQTVTMPDSSLLPSVSNGYKLLGWSTEIADYTNNYNPSMVYAVGSTYTNTVTQNGKNIILYPYYEGPAIKIALKPNSSSINNSADIKPSADGNTLNFHKMTLGIKRTDNNIPLSIELDGRYNYIIQKNGQFVLGSYSEGVFRSLLQPGTVEFTLTASSLADTQGYEKYTQKISKTISSGEDIVLDFNDMQCSYTTHTNCFAYGVFNFDFGTGVTKVEVAYGASSGSYEDVTSKKQYTLRELPGTDPGTDKLIINYTVNGTQQTQEYSVQLMRDCITSATIEITSAGCTIK